MALNVGELYVNIKADMSSVRASLSGLSGAVDGIGNNMNIKLSGSANSLNGFVNTALLGFSALRKNSSTIGDLFKTSKQGLKTGFSGIGTGISDLSKGFNSFTHTTRIAVSEIAKFAKTDIKQVFNSLGAAKQAGVLGNLFGVDKLKNGMREFGTAAKSALEDIQLGFMYLDDGFNAFASSVKVGVMALVTLTVAAFTKLLSLSKDFLVEGIKFNSMMEQYNQTFTVFIGNEERAVELMKELRDYANWSTFTTPQVAESAQQLLNYGVNEKDIMHVTRMLGDTSAGNPEKFSRQAYAFGQVFATGRLMGQDNRQFINAGFNPLQELSKMTGKTMATLKKDMEDGAISVDMVVAAFEHVTQKGGRFYQMQQKQSQTGLGLKSTIVDKATLLAGDATKKMYESLKPILNDIIGILDLFLANTDKIGASIEKNITPALQDAFGQFLNLFGISNDTESSMDDITDTIDTWTEGIGSFIKTLTVAANIGVLLVSIFSAGLLVCGVIIDLMIAGVKTLVSIFKLGFEVIKLVGQSFVHGLGALFEYLFKNLANKFIDIQNKIARIWNLTTPLTKQKPMQVWQKLEGNWNLDKAVELNNKSFEKIKEAGVNVAFDTVDAGGKFVEDLMSKMDGLEVLTNLVKNSLNNIFGDTSNVDDFLNSLKKPKPPKDDEQTGIETNNSTEDGAEKAKKMADAMNKVADEIKKAKEELYKFGDAFDKVTYERFSPNKLLNRTKKFFEQIAKFAVNLQKLENLGVSGEIINNIRGMGTEGYGVAAGLVKATPEQRSSILNNLSAIDLVAEQQGVKKVIFEHTGSITVKGKTTKDVLIEIAADISKDQNRYNKTTSDMFKD